MGLCVYVHAFTRAQLCLALFDPMNYSLPGSSVHGILQARILERLPFPPPGHLPKPGIKPTYPVSPALAGGFFIIEPPEKRYVYMYRVSNLGGTKQESEK